jgi:glyceraldehyde-3-phosphate dehydrogenase (NADP+)
MKHLLFECGGNNPAVVFPDADMSQTAREIVKGAFSYAGQRCTAIKYVLATPGTLEKLVPLVQKELKAIVHMGDPRSPETKLVGPVISPEAAEHVEKAIQEAVSQGATVLVGGKRNGTYVEPTLVTGVTGKMRIVKEEIFGPVLSFVEVKHGSSAAQFINDSDYGLQASVFTKDEGTGIAFAKTLAVGTVQINGSPQRGPDHFPFLGVKKSGVGVQGVRYSLEAMSRPKPIVLNQPR